MGIFSLLRQGDFGREFLMTLMASLAVLFFCLPIHEFAHGFVADKLGDPTARAMGRLDLNPFAHLDIIGSLAIILFGFGWAKPVPVNPRNFKNPKRDWALVSVAGPVANIIMALIFMIITKIIYRLGGFMNQNALSILISIFSYITLVNISLAVFNLIPIPPLDGSKIIGALLPARIYNTILQYERYAIIVVYVVMFSGILDKPMMFMINLILRFLDLITFFI